MKNLLESISNNAILEKVINILSDFAEDDIQSFDILKKSMNNLVNVKELLDRKKIKQDLLTSICLYKDTQYCKNFPNDLINELNNPDNFRKYAGLIQAQNPEDLDDLIYIAIDQLGHDGNLNWIDTSKITDMSDMFYDNKTFNGHIELWDVSHVKDFSRMFYNATTFNLNISQWDMSSATNVNGMFYNATTFNLPLNSWKLYNVQYMRNMFRRAERFNQPLDNWYVNNVIDMYYMFSGAAKFNQPIGNWNVSNVTNMQGMFCEAYSFKQDISNWKLNSKCATLQMYAVCNIPNEFKATTADTVNESINILSDIDGDELHNISVTTKNINSTRSIDDILRDKMLLELNKAFNHPLAITYGVLTDEVIKELNNPSNFEKYAGIYLVDDIDELRMVIDISRYRLGDDGNFNWINTSKVKSFNHLFSGLPFNGHIELWDTSNVEDMSGIFKNNEDFNLDISNWDTSKVTTLCAAFRGASAFNLPIGKWNTSNVKDMHEVFYNAESFNKPLNNWDVSNVVDMGYMFTYTKYNLPLNRWDTSSVVNTYGMFLGSLFNKPIDMWDMSNNKNMGYMFAFSRFNKPLNNWDTSSVISMSAMFAFAKEFNLYINKWDVSNVEWMNGMFNGNKTFNKSINEWDVSKVIHTKQMFLFATCDPSNFEKLYGKNKAFNMQDLYARYTD